MLFRKDKNKFLWPGFGDNIRVIEWIFNRCDQAEEPKAGYAVDSPLGFLPDIDNGAISLEGLEDEVEITPGGSGALAAALAALGTPWGIAVPVARRSGGTPG